MSSAAIILGLMLMLASMVCSIIDLPVLAHFNLWIALGLMVFGLYKIAIEKK